MYIYVYNVYVYKTENYGLHTTLSLMLIFTCVQRLPIFEVV